MEVSMQIEIKVIGDKAEVAPLLAFLAGTELGVVTEVLPVAHAAVTTEGPTGPPDTAGAGASLEAGGGAAGVELDDAFFPWDARINADSKKQLVKEKTWKLIRGIETKSPGLVEQVRAELHAQGFGVKPAGDTLPPGPGSEGDATPPGPHGGAPTLSFPQIIAAITTKVQAGEITDAQVDEKLQALGIKGGPPMVGTREDLFAQVIETLGLC